MLAKAKLKSYIPVAVLGIVFIVNLWVAHRNQAMQGFPPPPHALCTLARQYREGQLQERAGQWLDCSGYTRSVYKQFGIHLPRTSKQQYKYCTPVVRNELKPGDLVFFITRGKSISHVGLCLSDSTFIHSPGRGKKVCEVDLKNSYFDTRFYSGGRITFKNKNQ